MKQPLAKQFVNKAASMDAGWGQFRQLQDRFSALIQGKWTSAVGNNKTRNVVDSKRDLLFVWNAAECSVLVINVGLFANHSLGGKTHQVLELTSIPDFNVDRLLVNDTCTHLALVGARMASIVNLPARWGSSGLLASGKDTHLCKSQPVDASFLIRSQSLEIRDFRWCPAPLADNLFVLLTSNNLLRLYRADAPSDALQKWRVGRSLGQGALMNPQSKHLPLLACLGQTAVSFDFLSPMSLSSLDSSADRSDTFSGTSTPLPKGASAEGSQQHQDDDLVWPVAVLFGSGDVFIVVPPHFHPTAASGMNAKLFGPLRMFPSAPDNYGAESCSLLCLPCQPPVLAIASSSGGVVYHSVLLQKHLSDSLDAADVDDAQSSCYEPGGEDLGVSECQKALYVVEKVALELGLLRADSELQNESEESPYQCRIHLYKDPLSSFRYFCCHEAGVNIISVPLAAELLKTATNKISMEEMLDVLPTEGVASVAQYLLCTQASNQSSSHCIQGLTVLSTQSLAMAVLPSGRCALMPLPLALLQLNTSSPLAQLDKKEPAKAAGDENAFVELVKRALSHSASQPLVMLPPAASPSNKELLEILKKSTHTLRTEYLSKHVVVREEFKRKVSVLRNTVAIRMRQIDESGAQMAELTAAMEKTKANIEARLGSVTRIIQRMQQVHLQLNLAEPETSAAELKLREFVQDSSAKVQNYQATIKSLNARIAELQHRLEASKKAERKENMHLTEEQENTIKAALAENNKVINRMKMRLEHIMRTVNKSASA